MFDLSQIFLLHNLALKVFMQICKISSIDIGLSVSVCVSLYVSVSIVRTGRTLAVQINLKNEKWLL